MSRNRARRFPPHLDDLLFPICELFFSRKHTAEEISGRIQEKLRASHRRDKFSRAQVYDAISVAIDRGYVAFHPPCDATLARRLADLNKVAKDRFSVVNVTGPSTLDLVASRAAELTLELIARRAAEKRQESGLDGDVDIHLGLGAGYTTLTFARYLARHLERTRGIAGVSRLFLHAMNSGFSLKNPFSSPVSYFSYFRDSRVEIEYVMLFSPSLVKCEEYNAVKEQIGVRHAFQSASDIDIVVTSFASRNTGTGLLDRIEEDYVDVLSPAANEARKARAGDIQFRPYSAKGPLPDHPEGHRAVTLFEISDFVEMVRDGKYVVLVAAPTHDGTQTRTDALVPLFTRESLAVWSHVCLDVTTAGELVDALAP